MGNAAQQPLKSKDELREQRQVRARARAIALVERLLLEKAPELVAKKAKAGLSRDDSESIVVSLGDQLEGTFYLDARKHLRERLKTLREVTGGQVVLPPPATRIKRDKSPFAGEAFNLAARLEILTQQFHQELKHGLDFDHDAASFNSLVKRFKNQEPESVIGRRQQTLTIGRIVFSAITNGGMLHRRFYVQLPKMLCDHLRAHGDHAWLSFPLQNMDPKSDEAGLFDPTDPDQPVRRWFVDPVTLGLAARWRIDQSIEDCRLAAERVKTADALKAYLSYLSTRVRTNSGQAPRLTTKNLFDAAATRLSLYLPQIMVRYLKSVTEGSSLSERSWWRFANDLQVHYTSPRQDESESGPAMVDAPLITQRFAGDEAEFFALQESLIKILNQCLADPARPDETADNHVAAQAIRTTLEKRGSEMAPILNAWYRWVMWKLTRASKAQGRIVTSSANRYTVRLGNALIEIGAEMSIEDASESDWEAFYQDVLDSLKSNTDRTKAVDTLLQFQEFMWASFDVPLVTIEGQSGSRSRPRICLVNDNDYRRLMTVLDNGEQPSHRRQMLRLIAMLMYRVGLRPREIIGLEYRLIQGASRNSLEAGTAYPVLYLRVTSQEKLKTSSAVRQIPLPWFLTPAELAEFNQHLAQRLRAYRAKDQRSMLILSTARNNNQPLSQAESLSSLTHLLRLITDDPAMVAYSLRHSCFSHLFEALLSPDRKREGCRGSQLLRNGHTPREVAYSISSLAGHLDPVITLQFYVHMQDFVAYKTLAKNQVDLPLAIWSTLEGINLDSLEQRRRRLALDREQKKEKDENKNEDNNEMPQWLDTSRQLIRKLKCPMPKMRLGKDAPLPSIEFPERTLLELDMDDINALLLSGQRSYSYQARAEFFDLPARQIRAFFDHSQRLAGKISEAYSAKQQFRNLKVKSHSQIPEMFRRPQPGRFGPAPPNTRAERAEAGRIYKLLGNRALTLGFEPETVQKQILRPIRGILAAHARSESIIRANSAEQFQLFISTLRGLLIQQNRIEIEIESLPKIEPVDAKQWIKHLRKLAGAHKLRAAAGQEKLTRRSRHYPDFGIVKIRVLEVATAEVGELKRDARRRVGDRAGAGWRVGCFYACSALAALMDLPLDSSAGSP